MLTIDWDGVTAEQLKHYAQAHIIELCRAAWQHSDPPHVPETHIFECAAHPLHNDPVVMATREVRAQSCKTKKERWNDIIAAIASLPEEEQRVLLGHSDCNPERI